MGQVSALWKRGWLVESRGQPAVGKQAENWALPLQALTVTLPFGALVPTVPEGLLCSEASQVPSPALWAVHWHQVSAGTHRNIPYR